jgi:hypothetical protein
MPGLLPPPRDVKRNWNKGPAIWFPMGTGPLRSKTLRRSGRPAVYLPGYGRSSGCTRDRDDYERAKCPRRGDLGS